MNKHHHDRLFLYVRRFVYGERAYSFTVLLLRIFSCVKKSARIGWYLPLRYKRKSRVHYLECEKYFE